MTLAIGDGANDVSMIKGMLLSKILVFVNYKDWNNLSVVRLKDAVVFYTYKASYITGRKYPINIYPHLPIIHFSKTEKTEKSCRLCPLILKF